MPNPARERDLRQIAVCAATKRFRGSAGWSLVASCRSDRAATAQTSRPPGVCASALVAPRIRLGPAAVVGELRRQWQIFPAPSRL